MDHLVLLAGILRPPVLDPLKPEVDLRRVTLDLVCAQGIATASPGRASRQCLPRPFAVGSLGVDPRLAALGDTELIPGRRLCRLPHDLDVALGIDLVQTAATEAACLRRRRRLAHDRDVPAGVDLIEATTAEAARLRHA